MGLSFRQLAVLRAAARHGTVTAAAADLGVSQPAVSMMLRDCAATVGCALFTRHRGRLQPTPELRLLLDDIERIFASVDRIDRMVEDVRDVGLGSLAVAATPALADSLLPPAIAALRRRRPQVHVAVQAMDNIAATDAVLQGDVDLALVLTPVAGSDLRPVPLGVADLICVVPPDSPLAARGAVRPEDLAPYPLISFRRSLPLGRLIEQGFRQAGTRRRIALEVNQSSVALALVRAGAGVAVIDPFLMTEDRDHGVVCLGFSPRTGIEAQALVRHEAALSRPARMLLAILRRRTAALRGLAAPVVGERSTPHGPACGRTAHPGVHPGNLGSDDGHARPGDLQRIAAGRDRPGG